MAYALVLVVAVEVATVMVYVIHGKAQTIVVTVDVTTIIFAKHSAEKRPIRAGQTVDATPTQCVNLKGGKPTGTVKTVLAEVVGILVTAGILVQEVGWVQVDVNIPRVHATIQTVRFGLEQSVHVPLDKSALKAIAGIRMKKTVYRPKVLHGTIINNDVCAQVR
jgi:hypothetical protein